MAGLSGALLFLLSSLALVFGASTTRATTRRNNGARSSARTGTRGVSTRAPTDPKYSSAWYLKGTTAPSINVESLWTQGLSGRGVKVLVLDDSFDFTNPELLNKEYAEASYNYMTDSKDVSPTNSSQWHGTPVAGIIAATHNNSVCGVGVAPNSLIAGRVVIFDDTTVDILIQGLSENLGNIDIISNSWGIAPCDTDEDGNCADTYCNLIEDVGLESPVKEFATAGRGGKGGVVIFAAGDTGDNATSDINLNPAARIPYAISVGGVTSGLSRVTTSPMGKSLFITAPSADPNSTVGIIGPLSEYNDGTITHGCTVKLVGSGASAPIVSGVVALMFEANGDLTSDEVRQILMQTARKIDKDDSSWTTNSAGVSHSTKYGFGYVDAASAVQMAKRWTTCGLYVEQTTGVQTTLSSYYENCLVNGNIEVPTGRKVEIPFFMKSLGSVIIDSLSVRIENIVNSSVDIALREDERHVATSVSSRKVKKTAQASYTTLVNTTSDPSLANDTEGMVTLTTYQYAGMTSGGQWTMSIKNNGTTKLSIPLSTLSLTARGYPSVVELGAPVVVYQNQEISSITVPLSINDPGAASQDFGRGMRVYILVEGLNPFPATDDNGNPLVVDPFSESVVIPWRESYTNQLGGISTATSKQLRIILVDSDVEYYPFTFSTCHSSVSPVVLVNLSDLPITGSPEEQEEEEESVPPVEEEEECPPTVEPEEECDPSVEQEEEDEPIPSNPIYPPDEEEASDGFDFNPVGAAKLVSLLSAFLIALMV